VNKKDAFQYAVDAYSNKDYKTAHKMFLPLAEQEDSDAQCYLGWIYANGQGVPQDYKEAVRLFRLSAEQGVVEAQYNLGLMYEKGKGVSQDYASAHMWFNLSGSNGNKDAIEVRNLLEKKMTPSQLEKAQEMARNWKPKK